MVTRCDGKIKVIQGNSLTREFEIKNINLDYVYSIEIDCKELNLYKELFMNEEGKFIFNLTSDETSKMPDIHTTYNLDVVFIDGSHKTIFYEEQFIILPKSNRGSL